MGLGIKFMKMGASILSIFEEKNPGKLWICDMDNIYTREEEDREFGLEGNEDKNKDNLCIGNFEIINFGHDVTGLFCSSDRTKEDDLFLSIDKNQTISIFQPLTHNKSTKDPYSFSSPMKQQISYSQNSPEKMTPFSMQNSPKKNYDVDPSYLQSSIKNLSAHSHRF